MGRTLPTFTMNVDQTLSDLSRFRRALRREDQIILDGLFADARLHSQAGSFLSPVDPFPVILLCMLLEERRERLLLEGRLRKIEDRGEGHSS